MADVAEDTKMARDPAMASTRPSLEALKSLDMLPNISSQLQEAKRLCNHNARADMVCKWLLERLKSHAEFQQSPEAWSTLLSAFRLLSPARLASLLSAHDFLGTCKTAFKTLTISKAQSLCLAVIAILSFLLDVLSGPDGTQLKAALSLSASDSAELLGAWINAIFGADVCTMHNDYESARLLLRPAMEIWGLRKYSQDENELFARNCLIPTAQLLQTMDDLYAINSPNGKRKAEEAIKQSSREILESLLARHVLVPARAAFFKAEDTSNSSDRRQIGSQDPSYVLRSMLDSIKGFKSRADAAQSPIFASLPRLLEIVIRVTPMTTPKQRSREKPWIESVFKVLHECDQSGDKAVLIDMLGRLKQYGASLSKDMLQRLINDNKVESADFMYWQLLSNIIALDQDIFSDESKAEAFFSNMTAIDSAELEQTFPRDLDPKDENDVSKSTKADFLSKSIILPIMYSYASQRKLARFTEMWAKQLQDEKRIGKQTLWVELDAEFAPLLEDSLPQEQIIELFDGYFAHVESAANSQNLKEDQTLQGVLSSSVVILNAILKGVKSEALIDALSTKTGDLLELMMRFCPDASGGGFSTDRFTVSHDIRTWALITVAFELWFPSWMAVLSDHEMISDKCADLIMDCCYKTTDLDSRIRYMSPSVRGEFQIYVASLFHHLRDTKLELGEPKVKCLEAAEQLLRSSDDSLLVAALHCGDMVETIRQPTVNDLVMDFVSDRDSSLESFRSITATILNKSPTKTVDRVIEIFINCIRHSWDDDEEYDDEDEDIALEQKMQNENEEHRVLDILSHIPAESISRPHREQLINAVSQRQQNAEGSHIGGLESQRLALLVNLMSLNNATCTLMTDHEEIWRLARSVSPYGYAEECEATDLLEELTKQMASHLLATQEQERSRNMLIGLSSSVKTRLDFIAGRGQLDGSGRILALVGILVKQVELGAKDGLKAKLAHRDTPLMRSFLDTCFTSICAMLSDFERDETGAGALQPGLKTLLRTPDSILQQCEIDPSAWYEAFIKSTHSLQPLRHLGDYNTDTTLATTSILGLCSQLACKYATGDISKMATLAMVLARQEPQASIREDILASFADYVSRLEDRQYLDLFEILIRPQDHRKNTLPFAEICAARSNKAADRFSKIQYPRILVTLLDIITETNDVVIEQRAARCVLAALRGSSTLVNQHSIEAILTAIPKLLEHSAVASISLTNGCQLLSTLLLQYRSRLHGRFHMVVQVFQALISRLFVRASTTAPTSKSSTRPTVKHVQVVASLLTLFCEPPQSKRQSKSSELVDELRKEQAEVGKFVQYILHHYCNQILEGKMEPGMREALIPGLWSVIEAMEIGDAEGVKSLSAAMNNSERAVLRGVYDEWRRFGKWTGA